MFVEGALLQLTERIREYERKLEEIAKEHYPERGILRQVGDVGALSALSFVLILEDPSRFKKSRPVGAYPWDSSRGRTARERAILRAAHLQKRR